MNQRFDDEYILRPELEISPAVMEVAAGIKLVLFDVDGVLTNGQLFFDDNGTESKAFHSRDGLGINLLQQSGVQAGIITARTSNLVAHRARNLKIAHLVQGAVDKYPAYLELRDSLGLDDSQIAFVGDDVVDLPVMLQVGLAVTVPEAHPLVLEHAHWTTVQAGGYGAARDVCEMVMHAQGTYTAAMQQFLMRTEKIEL